MTKMDQILSNKHKLISNKEQLWDKNREWLWDKNGERVWNKNGERLWDKNRERLWKQNGGGLWNKNIGLLWNKVVLIAAILLGALSSYGIPANPESVRVCQPDGSMLTLKLHGDEYCNFTTTSLGYTVEYNPISQGWEYAELATDGSLRPAGELALEHKLPQKGYKWLRPQRKDSGLGRMGSTRSGIEDKRRLGGKQYDYSKFKGLVVLVEFNDKSFARSDIQSVMNSMINDKGYTGYFDTRGVKVECTGSVRDYYYENSNGVFDPVFDVVGPVKINHSQMYAKKTTGGQVLVQSALKAADAQVDFSRYDTDKDGKVDMVYLIFAGAGSNYSGNDQNLLWPHASSVIGMSLDGVKLGRYACSVELYGKPTSNVMDGIGTMCHEFSHVLGLSDLYDTDGDIGGQSSGPGRWSVMSTGSYLNKARTPCGYSLYEKYALGFAQPRNLSKEGEYSIRPMSEKGASDGMLLRAGSANEFFMLESRRKERWDQYLPGEGLLIHRVDSTSTEVWDKNKVNALASHNYYEMLRATPKVVDGEITYSDGDPFPGSGRVTQILNIGSPNLRSWVGARSELVITGITRADDGTVSFKAQFGNSKILTEDFSGLEMEEGGDWYKGRFAKWRLSSGVRIADDLLTDSKALSIVKGEDVVISPADGGINWVSILIDNPTTTSAIFRFFKSKSADGPWEALSTVEGSATPSVAAGTRRSLQYQLESLKDSYLCIQQFSGTTTNSCYICRFEICVDGENSGVKEVNMEEDRVRWFNLQGAEVAQPLHTPGIYLKLEHGRVEKVLVK